MAARTSLDLNAADDAGMAFRSLHRQVSRTVKQKWQADAMRIGFDISQVEAAPGCGYYAEALACELIRQYADDRFLLYRSFGEGYWNPDCSKNIPQFSATNCLQPLILESHEESQTFWGRHFDIDEARCGNPDVIHANNFCCPLVRRARVVYTVYDLSFIDLPECTTEHNRSHCFEGMLMASLRADMVVAISHYSRQRFLEVFPHFPSERAVVAHLGNRLYIDGPTNAPQGMSGMPPFFLSVCTLEPRKNLRRLLTAYQRYAAGCAQPTPLILSGGKGWMEDGLTEDIARRGLTQWVHVTGFVSDPELRWLYQHCHAFVYPSLYEGFGLPVLEAMNFGAAVITSQTTSLPEVGGAAVLYVDPLDEESMAIALKSVDQQGCRQALQAKSLQQATQFSWTNTAKTVYAAYEQALCNPRCTDWSRS